MCTPTDLFLKPSNESAADGRSKAMDLQEPGPSPESLNTILDSALRVPDHGKPDLGGW